MGNGGGGAGVAFTVGGEPVCDLSTGCEPVPDLIRPDTIASARERRGLLGASELGRLGRFGLGAVLTAAAGPLLSLRSLPGRPSGPSRLSVPAARRGGGRRLPQPVH